MSEKIKRKESVVQWSSYELDGKLEDVISKLQGLIKSNPTYFDFSISVESVSEYYGSCSTEVKIDAYRWETDDECEERKIASKKRSESAKLAAKSKADANAKRERSLYESLKKKFEKEINETSNQLP